MTNKNDILVVGLFPNEAGSRAASDVIKEWDDAEKDIDLGAMAILTMDLESGTLKSDEIGERKMKKGLGWGMAIGVAASLVTGPLGLVIGSAVGAGLGALLHKSVGMTDDQQEELFDALKLGGAALAIMADNFEVDAVVAKLREVGGNVDHYDIVEETSEVISATVQPPTREAIDEALNEVDESALVEASRMVEAEAPDLEPEDAEAVARIVAVTSLSAMDVAKLNKDGVENVSGFLDLAATQGGRSYLSKQTGINEEALLYEAKKLDLMRIKGLGHKYATLLIAAGVESAPELATRNPALLAASCARLNETKKIVEELPSEKMISDWVGQAKVLQRVVYQ